MVVGPVATRMSDRLEEPDGVGSQDCATCRTTCVPREIDFPPPRRAPPLLVD
jgi:hypothetical protein